MTVQIRFILWHDRLGVFLGTDAEKKLMWSKDDGRTGDEKAPTFASRQDLEQWLSEHEGHDFPTGAELREVWPRWGGGIYAGAEECANAGIPRWGVRR